MKILGIDPGLSGAICLLNTETQEISFINGYKVKKANGRNEFNLPIIIEFLKNNPIDKCIIEKAQPMPGQGVVSMFTTGLNYGKLYGLLSAFNIPFIEIHPTRWIKHFKFNKYTKEEGYLYCSKIYPSVINEFKGPKGGLLDGKVDAFLIAKYGESIG